MDEQRPKTKKALRRVYYPNGISGLIEVDLPMESSAVSDDDPSQSVREGQVIQPAPTVWTEEMVDRYLRLSRAHDEGRFYEQFDIEFPLDPETGRRT